VKTTATPITIIEGIEDPIKNPQREKNSEKMKSIQALVASV